MPSKVIIYAINVEDNTVFDDRFSPQIQNAIKQISEHIKKDIEKYLCKFH